MAVEVVGFEMVQGPVENGAEGGKPVLHEKENGKPEQDPRTAEAIKFGTHGDESAKGEGNDVSDAIAPKDAVEEWPAPKQIHSFYFVRWRPYDDPTIKSKIDQLDREISKKNQARFQVTEALKAKRSERADLISQIKSLRGDSRQFQSMVDEKIKEIEPLQQALGKLRTTNNAGGRGGLCSSEEELNNVIYSLQYRIQHESIPLTEEKQLLREIKQFEGTREKVIANAAMRTKLQESMGQKEAIQDQVKLIGGDLDGVKKERQTIRSKIKQIDDALKIIDKDIQSLQDELTAVSQKRDKFFESMQQLRKQREEGNAYFYQSRTLVNKARELAARKDINGLDELSLTEVEKFMALWNGEKTFRNDYEKRILQSLDMRQLSRDGRMRNPDEKPLLEEPKPAETDALPKAVPKQPKEEPKPIPQETLPAQKESKNKGRDLKSKPDNNDLAETDEYEFEIPQKETPAKEPEIDPAKVKEMKREEEIAKAKQALERKRKLAEKAAAKAALRAQKEAEKKLKDREKKAKKKASGAAAVSNSEDEPKDQVVEVTEPEKVDDNVQSPALMKEKVQKESGIRSRNRARGPDSVPKAILKRKKSNNYWVWVSAAAAALLVLLLVVLGYIYLF